MSEGRKFVIPARQKWPPHATTRNSQKWTLASTTGTFLISSFASRVLCAFSLRRMSRLFSSALKPHLTLYGLDGMSKKMGMLIAMGRMPSIRKIQRQARHPRAPSRLAVMPYAIKPLKAPANVDMDQKTAPRVASSLYSYQKERSKGRSAQVQERCTMMGYAKTLTKDSSLDEGFGQSDHKS